MITSPNNETVKDLVRLRTRRRRDSRGLFLIEGIRPVQMALESGVEIERLFVAPSLGGEASILSEDEASISLPGGATVVEMSEAPFRKVSIRQNPDGLLALARQLPTDLDRLDPGPSPLILLLERIEKPGNLGAILRTADAAGVGAVVVCDPATDVHNPNVVQASQGALFAVRIGVAGVTEALAWLSARSIRLAVTTPTASRALWDDDLTGPVAVAVGSEAEGLSETLLSAADSHIGIPMKGLVDSLNASVSAALVLYEAVRQRR